MLHGIRELNEFSILVAEGAAGTLKDVCTESEHQAITHLLIAIGPLASREYVAVDCEAVALIDWNEHCIFLEMSRQQLRDSPTAEQRLQQDQQLPYDYFDDPYYWTGSFLWGAAVFPGVTEAEIRDSHAGSPWRQSASDQDRAIDADPESARLQSLGSAIGWSVHATDGTLGHVTDFLFSEDDWSLQWVVVDPRNWWPGPDVLIPMSQLEGIDWSGHEVAVAMTRRQVRSSPEYDATHPPPAVLHGARRSRAPGAGSLPR